MPVPEKIIPYDMCGQCIHIREKNGARCKNPASCLVGCWNVCYLHANYHKYQVCDESVWTEQTAALQKAQTSLEYLQEKRRDLLELIEKESNIRESGGER
jgi:hypothetical protein